MKRFTKFKNSQILILIQLAHVIDFALFAPLSSIFIDNTNMTISQFTSLMMAYSFGAFSSGFLNASLTKKFSNLQIMKVYLGLLMLAFAGMSLVPFYQPMLCFRFLNGWVAGGLSTFVLCSIDEWVTPRNHGKMLAYISFAFPISSLLGVPLCLGIAQEFGIRYVYGGMAFFVFLLLSLLLNIRIDKVSAEFSENGLSGLNRKLESGRHRIIEVPNLKRLFVFHELLSFRNFFIAHFLLVLGGFSLVPYISPLLISQGHLSAKDLSSFYLVSGLFSVLATYWIGNLLERYSRLNIFGGTIFFVILLLLFSMVIYPQVNIVLLGLIVALLPARFISYQAMVLKKTPQEHRKIVLSLNTSVMYGSFAISTFVASLLVNRDAGGNFKGIVAIFFLALLANLLAFMVQRRADEQLK